MIRRAMHQSTVMRASFGLSLGAKRQVVRGAEMLHTSSQRTAARWPHSDGQVKVGVFLTTNSIAVPPV